MSKTTPEGDQSSEGRAAPREAFREELADELGMPVITVVSGWEGNTVVNLGEEAARAFLAVLDAELEGRKRRPKSVGLFLIGRGGFASFADGVTRALEGRDLSLRALIPYQTDGAFSLISLAAKRCLLHPYGALGAYDRRPLGRIVEEIDAELIAELSISADEVAADDEVVARIAAERRHARLARRLMERLVGGADSKLASRLAAQMSAEVLGRQLALSAAELKDLGVSAKLAGGDLAETMWALYRAYATELGVLEPAIPRYTESEVADEVEF
ncbi:MAG: SDH family Clp fold serine proteinase, partial [Persicimonas sp.]